ncbi:unnamed protein product [Closterium sp. NIES-53]
MLLLLLSTVQGPAPSGVSQVDAVEPVEVAVDSGAATGAEPAGAGSGGAGSGGAETEGAEPGGAEFGGAEPGGAATGGTEPGGAEPGVTEPGGAEPGGAESTRVFSRGASSRREVLSPQKLREWFARRWSRAAGAGGPTASTCPGGAGAAVPGGPAEAAGVGPTGGSTGASGAAGGVGAGGSAGVGTSEGAGAGAIGAGGATGIGAPTGSPGAVPAGSGGALRPRPYFVPLLEQVLGLPPSPGPAPPLESPQPVQSQSLFQPVSPLPAPSPYTGPTGGLAELRVHASRLASPARPACTSRRTSRPRPPAVPGTHQMALRPSTAPLRVPLPSPHAVGVLTSVLVFFSPIGRCFVSALVPASTLGHCWRRIGPAVGFFVGARVTPGDLTREAPGRHRPEHMAAAKRVLRYLCSTSGMGLVLGGRSPVVLTGHADASWADDQATQRSSQGYTFGLGSGSVSWRATRSSSVLGSNCEAEIYAGAMAAQELRWLTYLLTDLGEPPRSPPVLYVDNKAMLALCREQRLEHRTKHIALRYFLARELQQRGQLRLAYVASEANTADVFTKALAPCDHQRCCTQLGLVPLCFALLDWSCDPLFSRTLPMGHRTKHIALRYFLSRELQQRGQLRLAYVASEANTADIFTKALAPGDHQRFCTLLACFALLDWSSVGAAGAPGGAGAAGGRAGAGAAGGAAGAPGGAGAAGGGAGAGAAGAGGAPGGAGAAGGGAGAGAAGGTAGAPAGAGSAGGAGGATGGPGAGAVSGGAARPRPYFILLLQQVLGSPLSPGPPPPPFLSPPPVQSQSQLQPASPLPGPFSYSGPTRGLTERREPESRPVSPESRPASPVLPIRAVCGSRTRLPPVPGTHSMTLRPSTAPQRVPLPSPLASSLPDGPDPESDSLCAASPSVTRFLATAITEPLFESSAASALVTKLVDFAATCRLDYAASLVAESASVSVCPQSVGGECALGTDVLEDRQEDLECFAAASPHLLSMLLAPEGDPDAVDIPTPRSYAEAIEGTYVDEVPPPGANIVSGMWIFRVKRPPGSPPAFKARYVARGFSQQQGVDFFQTFSPTAKMTILRVLLHVAAQRDHELHSLDFSIAFLQGSLHEEIWLRRPPGFTGSFPPGTQWSLRRPVYDDLVFATANTEALAHVKSELQKRHTCTDLGELTSYLGLRITRDRAQRTITLTQSHMVQQVLQRFGFTYSSPQSTPLPTGHSLSAPPSDESVEPSGPYPEFVGCLMYLMTSTRPDLAYPLSLLARYVAPGRHQKVHRDAAKRVLQYLCSTSGMGLVLGGRARVVLTGHADAFWANDLTTQRSSQGYTFSLGSGSVSWRSTRSSSVLNSSCEAEIYAGAMTA